MTEIDFGNLVARLMSRMDLAENELIGEEHTDTYKAMRRYKAAVAEEIRAVFDAAETLEETVPPCTRCGADVKPEARFCGACGLPLTMDALLQWVRDTIAKDAGAAADDPRVMQALLTLREGDPEGWIRMMQTIEAAVNDAATPAA